MVKKIGECPQPRGCFMKEGDLPLHPIPPSCQPGRELRPNHRTRQLEGPSGGREELLQWRGAGGSLLGVDLRANAGRGSGG